MCQRNAVLIWVTNVILLNSLCLSGISTLNATEAEFNPRGVMGLRRFPPIIHPPTISAEEGDAMMREDELVIGVSAMGESRAYPINMLTSPWREIFNDELGGKPILVTWCHLCHNAIVFDPIIDGKQYTFAVSGMLWQRNLVMQDKETKSLWSHMLGKAMRGKLKGTELQTIPSTVTTWKAWRAIYPNTTVVDMERSSQRYESGFYRRPGQFVLGYAYLGGGHAWSFADLQAHPVINDQIKNKPVLVLYESASTGTLIYDRVIEGQTLTFESVTNGLRDRETGSIWNPERGLAITGPMADKKLKPLVGIIAYRSAWQDFYPDSTYWSVGK